MGLLSDRAKKWIRTTIEKVVGEYEEGARPPERLRSTALAFAELNPHATRREWLAFAVGFAGECWRAGYLRGYERAEREDEAVGERPEEIADMLGPDWREVPMGDPRLDELVPDGFDAAGFANEVIDIFGREARPWTRSTK